MHTIRIIAKQPPGGRCSLYGRYAQALGERLGCRWEVLQPATIDAAVPPPAMLVDGTAIGPSDGVILSPEDIAGHLRRILGDAAAGSIAALLEEVQERWMEECGAS